MTAFANDSHSKINDNGHGVQIQCIRVISMLSFMLLYCLLLSYKQSYVMLLCTPRQTSVFHSILGISVDSVISVPFCFGAQTPLAQSLLVLSS